MDWKTVAEIIIVIVIIGTPLFKLLYPLLKCKLTAGQLALIDLIADTVIHTAEQLFKIGEITDRKAWALEKLQDWIEKIGIKTDLDRLSDIIEAHVSALNIAQGKKQ